MSNKLSLNLLIIDTHDPRTLGVGDLSFYPMGMQIVSPTIQITPPAFQRITLPYTAKQATFYNSNTLGLTNSDDDSQLVDLPDGVWKIKYSISPANTNFVEKSFLRSDYIQAKFAKALLTTDISSCDSSIKDADKLLLDEVWYYIQGAIADANTCNDTAAMDKYRIANKVLDRFLKTK
jgi:hypothetical protein